MSPEVACNHRRVETPADHTIRPARRADAGRIAEIYAGYVETSAATFEEQAPTAAEMAQRMEERPRMPWLVAVASADTVVGFAYASPHHARSAYRWSLNCSVYLHEAAQGRGIAAALYRDLIDAVRDLGYVSLFAGIALPNDASVALHERLGFRRVAVFPVSGFKLGMWREVGWWWLPLRDPPEQPQEPAEWDS
jgi:L-amino acid N-acyltransferase YncA